MYVHVLAAVFQISPWDVKDMLARLQAMHLGEALITKSSIVISSQIDNIFNRSSN